MASKKKKKSVKIKSKQNISVPRPTLYPLSNKKPEEKHKRIFHAVGVMKTEQESYHDGMYSKFTPEQIKSHIPQYNLVPYSKGKKPAPLSAARMEQDRNGATFVMFS